MKPLSILFSILLFLYCMGVTGQINWVIRNSQQRDSIMERIKESHKLQLEKHVDNEALKEIYKERQEFIVHLFEIEAILYEDSLYNYVDFIFDLIIKSNPELQPLDLRYFISNSPIPNTFSLGDGTFIINIGLIRKLDNEGQLAFVLCHEIAHYYLDHSNKSAIDRYNKTHSKEYKKEAKSIAKQKFERYKTMKSMLKENIYSEMHFSRQHEIEADSLGNIFLKNSIYGPAHSITCLNLMDTIDYYKYSKNISYFTVLSFEEYPFRERWLEQETSMFGGRIEDNYWDRDSIKSHPDSKFRAELLEKNLADEKLSMSRRFVQDSTYFVILKDQLDYEFIESWVFYDNYSRALFNNLKQLETDPDNEFLLLKAGYIFKLIYESQANHQFDQYIDRPSAENEKEYNQFLDFLDNIRLSELANIGYYYHMTHADRLKGNKEFLATYNYFKIKTGN